MIVYANDENYDELVSEGIVIADFFGKTCGPCKMVARSLEEIDDEFPFIKIVKVDVDDCPKKSDEFHIEGIPDLFYYKDGKIISEDPGAVDTEYIRNKLANIIY